MGKKLEWVESRKRAKEAEKRRMEEKPLNFVENYGRPAPAAPIEKKAPVAKDDPSRTLAFLLLKSIKANLPDFKEPNIDFWIKVMREILEEEERNPESVKHVIEWCQNKKGFWWDKVMSPIDLRYKFDKLEAGMRRDKKKRVNDYSLLDIISDYLYACDVIAFEHNVAFSHSGDPQDWYKELKSKGVNIIPWEDFKRLWLGEEVIKPSTGEKIKL